MADEPENQTLQVLRQMRREQADTANSFSKLIRNSEERVGRDIAALKHDVAALQHDMGTLRQDMGTLKGQMTTLRDDLGRQIAMLRDELETTIKIEIGGALAHLETRLEDRMDERFEDFKREQIPPHP